MHNKNHIRKTLLKWLNAEWKAKNKGDEHDGGDLPHAPFQNDSMNLMVPKGKSQGIHVSVLLRKHHTSPSTTPKSHTRRTAATVVSSCADMHTLCMS